MALCLEPYGYPLPDPKKHNERKAGDERLALPIEKPMPLRKLPNYLVLN
jgi:hypothetical protein